MSPCLAWASPPSPGFPGPPSARSLSTHCATWGLLLCVTCRFKRLLSDQGCWGFLEACGQCVNHTIRGQEGAAGGVGLARARPEEAAFLSFQVRKGQHLPIFPGAVASHR